MPQFIYTLKARRLGLLTDGPNLFEAEVLQAHVEYLEKLLDEGVAVLFGRTQTQDEETFGIVIFEANTESEASEIMANDPCVKQGVMTARLFPYKVAGMRGTDGT